MSLLDFVPDTDEVIVELGTEEKPILCKDKTPMTITFYAPHTTESRKVDHEIVNMRLKKSAVSGRNKVEITSESLEISSTLRLAKKVKSWNLEIDGSGKTPFTVQTARELFADPRFGWVKAKCEDSLAEAENFMLA